MLQVKRRETETMSDLINLDEFTITITSEDVLEWIVEYIECEIERSELSYKCVFSINDSATFQMTTKAPKSREDATRQHETLLGIMETMGFKKLGGSKHGVNMVLGIWDERGVWKARKVKQRRECGKTKSLQSGLLRWLWTGVDNREKVQK